MAFTDLESDEQRALRREVYQRRRSFATGPQSRIVKELREAMTEYLRMRAEGVSREDACRGLEAVLRGVFPVSKFQPACNDCDDIGWRIRTCADRVRCGRPLCELKGPEWEHDYAEPCDCPKGERRRQQAQNIEDAIAKAARVSKRQATGWQPVGR